MVGVVGELQHLVVIGGCGRVCICIICLLGGVGVCVLSVVAWELVLNGHNRITRVAAGVNY